MRPLQIEGESVRLRQWCRGDFDFYSSFLCQEATAKHYGGKLNEAQAWRHLASMIGHWELRGFGVWAVECSSDHGLIGCAGYWQPWDWDATELAFWFTEDAYEKGYPPEALEAVLEYACCFPEIGRVVCYIAPENRHARALVESMGAVATGTINLGDFGAHCAYDVLVDPAGKEST